MSQRSDPKDPEVEHVPLEELLERSDIVVLACPLTSETHHLLDAARLEHMKPGALLVNVARGPIVDQEALVAALPPGGWPEPVSTSSRRSRSPPDDPILTAPHVVAAPHALGYLDQLFRDCVAAACGALLDVAAGRVPADVANPAVLDSPAVPREARTRDCPLGPRHTRRTTMIDAADLNALLHGSTEAPSEMRMLRAGPVTVLLDDVDLRYMRIGRTELVRRIYAAVRDRNWNTVPGADLRARGRRARRLVRGPLPGAQHEPRHRLLLERHDQRRRRGTDDRLLRRAGGAGPGVQPDRHLRPPPVARDRRRPFAPARRRARSTVPSRR